MVISQSMMLARHMYNKPTLKSVTLKPSLTDEIS